MSLYRSTLTTICFTLIFSLGIGCHSDETNEPKPKPQPVIVDTDNQNNQNNGTGSGTNDPSVVSILFVGNSLTYFNDLPLLVLEGARKKGLNVRVKSITRGNTALDDHWNEGEVHSAMRTEHFDFVVVQQGPSSQQEGRNILLEYGALFSQLCKEHESRLVFYMVWPALANYHTFNGVIKNYSDAASENNALLCPVGAAWKAYMDSTGDFSYYGSDQFHPSLTGSLVAAEIIVRTLFP